MAKEIKRPESIHRLVPIDLDSFGKSHELEVNPKFVMVGFGDTVKFREWERKVSAWESSEYVSKINQKFLEFRNGSGTFVKTLGDGLMAVRELPENQKERARQTFDVILKSLILCQGIEKIRKRMGRKGPDGFRMRWIAGWVGRIEIINKEALDDQKVDYTGEHVSLAFNLLKFQPKIPIICAQNVMEFSNEWEDKNKKKVKFKRLRTPEEFKCNSVHPLFSILPA